jgi:SAM-dependent methyltransferase
MPERTMVSRLREVAAWMRPKRASPLGAHAPLPAALRVHGNVMADGLIVCNFCSTVFGRSGPDHSEFLACPGCDAIARERVMYHCILAEQARETGTRRPFIGGNADLGRRAILECSPRFNARRRAIYREVFARYLSCDFDLKSHRADVSLDLTRDEEVTPYGDAFDIILCSSVLEHIPDYRAALRNLSRMLRPDGFLILQVPLLEARYTRVTWDEFHEDHARTFHRFGFDLVFELDEIFGSVTPVVGQLQFPITSPEVSRDKYAVLESMAERCRIIGAEASAASGLGMPDLCDAFVLRA